ncbi:MAG: hypothetical protein HDT29_00075 [Clostridiales bacterium]|nr:hypothetical protein [Clostridiales bacterium]
MKNILNEISKKLYNGTIILLSNVYGRTKLLEESKLNIISEFFSEDEYDYILTSLKEAKYDVFCYFNENDFIKDYLNDKIQFKEFLVFNLARNGYGISKKSLIPTFCDLNKIKYTGSNGYACSLARNKYHVNALLKCLGLNTLSSYLYNNGWLNNDAPKENKTKFIVKPLFESASQGITKNSIYTPSLCGSLQEFVKNTFIRLNKSPLIVQQFIEGYEAKTTIIDLNTPYALPTIGVQISGRRNLKDLIISEELAFNYEHDNYILASELGNTIADKIAQNALKIYNAIGMQNYGRIDCRIDAQTKEIYFMDFSTMPYFVSGGEMLFAFKTMGMTIHNLLNAIINSALMSKYKVTLGNT